MDDVRRIEEMEDRVLDLHEHLKRILETLHRLMSDARSEHTDWNE